MLLSMTISDFAIVDRIDVEFSAGMTVLTGETGAGKSILVDALGLVLGERGGNGLVREGAKRAEFAAEFDLAGVPVAAAWLEENALDADGECLLRRVINADGRSRAFINGNAVPLQSLKAIGEFLVDIHGQHFHQSLGKSTTQRDLLDHFADAGPQVALTASTFLEWQSMRAELDALENAQADRASRLDLLQFQCGELAALDLQQGEIEQLQSDRARLLHAGRLADGVMQARALLSENDIGNAQSLVAEASRLIDSLCEYDDALQSTADSLREADIQIAEAADELNRYGDSLDMDPALRDRVEERLDAVQALSRKHRVEPEQLHEVREKLEKELYELQHADEISDKLRKDVADAEGTYRETATELTRLRKEAATRFSHDVTVAMADLGMGGGSFEIAIRERAAGSESAAGLDTIEYLISANPGQPPMPLSKVASGGELSRMSLAIQVIASDGSHIPTMVFDEVDSGVGGGIAEMVGQRLRDVASNRQVLCVTHLPQVASLAHQHYRIMKVSDGKVTRTGVDELLADDRVDELARMLGGVEITQRTRDHAAEMLKTGAGSERRAGKA